MIRRYIALTIAVTLAALLIGIAGRRPLPATLGATTPSAIGVVTLELRIERGTVSPDPAIVPKGRQVNLRVTNGDAGAVRFRLAGYEDRFDPGAIEPGATWRGSFLADRPGEDFAWLIDDRPAGRLRITGSHLEEGHR